VAAAFVTFGLSVGLPYYNIPFFYDYFEGAYHWRRVDITRGFFYATLLTLWVGPVLIPRFSARKLILAGTALTAIAFLCWGTWAPAFGLLGNLADLHGGLLPVRADPAPDHHLELVPEEPRKAMGVLYVGVGVVGSLGAKLVRPLTEALGFHAALMIMGGLVMLVWPLALWVLRDRPAEMGLFPDGAATPAAEVSAQPRSFRSLLGRYSFWLLVAGSMCSIGSIGAVNFS